MSSTVMFCLLLTSRSPRDKPVVQRCLAVLALLGVRVDPGGGAQRKDVRHVQTGV